MRISDRLSRGEDGFTLIESLIAMCVFSIGILSLYTMHVTSIMYNAKASTLTNGTTWAMEKLEELIEIDYDDIEDTDEDGKAGLDDLIGADGQAESSDGSFTLYWNVANDLPIDGCKILRVHAQDNTLRLNNVVTYQYIKEQNI
jgi:prepilin-type N-terminal cleavage/methylation domain-containing protein